jgi:two-component system nitrate/nitrite response regulator NarL
VVTVHDHRFLAAALREELLGRAEVIGDTAYGAAALQLAGLLTPQVVVVGELLGDGLVDHFLPGLVRTGAHVLLVADDLGLERAVDLVARGLAGICTVDAHLSEVAAAVLEIAAGGVVLPPAVTAAVVGRWRTMRRTAARVDPAEALTLRERDVLNAMLDGLSTKAAARLLGISAKTVETHKNRVFAKLGVRNQAQLIGGVTPAEASGVAG